MYFCAHFFVVAVPQLLLYTRLCRTKRHLSGSAAEQKINKGILIRFHFLFDFFVRNGKKFCLSQYFQKGKVEKRKSDGAEGGEWWRHQNFPRNFPNTLPGKRKRAKKLSKEVEFVVDQLKALREKLASENATEDGEKFSSHHIMGENDIIAIAENGIISRDELTRVSFTLL